MSKLRSICLPLLIAESDPRCSYCIIDPRNDVISESSFSSICSIAVSCLDFLLNKSLVACNAFASVSLLAVLVRFSLILLIYKLIKTHPT